jgi:hypothetical protein
MIIRAPSRVSLQTFINFVYLYVNKQFTTQTLLKVAPNVGHDVKIVYIFTLQIDEWCVHNRLFNANFEDKFK